MRINMRLVLVPIIENAGRKICKYRPQLGNRATVLFRLSNKVEGTDFHAHSQEELRAVGWS
jgi:hypothetical protein